MSLCYAETKQFEALKSDEVFYAMKRALEKSNEFELKKSDAVSGQLYITRGASLKSFGEKIYISVQPEIGGISSISIRSELKWGLADYGRNHENLALLYDMLQKELKQ